MRDVASGVGRAHLQCPQCSAIIEFKLSTTVRSPSISNDESIFVKKSAVEKFAAEQQVFLAEAERTGVLRAFTEALERSGSSEAEAKDKGKVLLTWFKNAKLRPLPRSAVAVFREEFPRGYLEFYGSQGVIGVVVEKVLRQFIPQHLVVSTAAPRVLRGIAHRLPAPEQDAQIWVRGRHGYVPLDSTMFSEAMRQRNVGEFAKLVQ